MGIKRISRVPGILVLQPGNPGIVSANSEAGKLLNIELDQLVGLDFTELIDFSKVSVRELDREALRAMWRRQLGLATAQVGVMQIKVAGSTSIDVEFAITLIGDKQEIPLLIFAPVDSALQDNKELVAENDRLRLLTDSTLDSIETIDSRGRITFWNKGAERLYGYTEEEILGKEVTMLMPEEQREAHRVIIENTLKDLALSASSASGLDGQLIEMEALHKDGHVFTIEVSNSLVCSGQHAFAVAVSRDITQRKEAEARIEALNRELEDRVVARTKDLEEANMQLRRLAYEVGQVENKERRRLGQLVHDTLGQSVAIARMELSAITDRAPVVAKVIEILDQTVEQTRNLCKQLYPPGLHINGLVPTLEWLAEYMLDEYGLVVETELDLEAEPGSDELRIFFYRSAHELLMNVVKHAGVKTARLRMWTEAGRIFFAVSDNGKGMKPYADGRAYPDKFGLLSVQQQALYFGGILKIQTEHGKGTEVTIAAAVQNNAGGL